MAKIEFLSPVGRLVYGSFFVPQTTDFDGKPLLIRSGPNMGQPTQQYVAGLAISKTDPELPEFWGKLVAAARAGFPHFFDANGACTNPNFSFKMLDGDGVDQSGKQNNQKEGYAGCYVFKFSSSFPPRVFRQGRYGPQDLLTKDKHDGEIRRGYYYRIGGTTEGNGNAQKPGVYLNLSMGALWALGDEITSGPDAAAVFGAASAAALPAGARALPAAPPASSIPGMPGMAAPAAMAMPGQVGAPLAMPGMQAVPAGFAQGAATPGLPAPLAPAPLAVQPNPAFTAGPGGVAMPGMAAPAPLAAPMAPAPVAAGPQMTAAAGGHSYEAHIASGWTDATLRAAGKML